MLFTELEELVLKTLSFYEPMTLAKIILGFENEILKKHPHFNQEDLEQILLKLRRMGLVSRRTIKDQRVWQRTHPPRTWYSRLWLKLSTLF